MGNLGPGDLRLMQGLAQRVMAARPELVNAETTVGELAWTWGKDVDALGDSWRHRMWYRDGELAGWGWAHLPYRVARGDGTFRGSTTAGLTWQAPADLLPEILDWFDSVAGDVDRTLTVQVADTAALAVVAAHGYAHDTEDDDWTQFNVRELADLPEPVLPAGFRFRSAADVPAADLVRAHRAAWHPSTFTDTGYARLRTTWPYRADLHLLVEAPDGTFAGTAFTWLDTATRTAEFEPVGTHPDFRRRGLGTALQLHGMRLARAAGADRMFVACRGADVHPAARAMYYGVGFRKISRDVPYVKRR